MSDRTHCPHCPNRFPIGHEVMGVYDGVLYWGCPDCGGTWHRWSPQHWQHQKAEKYIHGPTKDHTTPKE